MLDGVDSTTLSIESFLTSFNSFVDNIFSSLEEFRTTVKSIPADIITGVKEELTALYETYLGRLIDNIKSLWIPDENYFDEKITVLRDKFGFINSVIDTITVVTDFLETCVGMDAPKIEIDLSQASGSSIYYGETAYILDLSWYAPFKPKVDAFLSAVMWLFFCWRVFMRLPNIINGIAHMTDTFTD